MEALERNRQYGEALREFTVEELLELLSGAEAKQIDADANAGKDILQADVSESAMMCRFNRGTYDDYDGAEDFMYESTALASLTRLSQTLGTHEAGERVRLLRSARACIFFTSRAPEDTDS